MAKFYKPAAAAVVAGVTQLMGASALNSSEIGNLRKGNKIECQVEVHGSTKTKTGEVKFLYTEQDSCIVKVDADGGGGQFYVKLSASTTKLANPAPVADALDVRQLVTTGQHITSPASQGETHENPNLRRSLVTDLDWRKVTKTTGVSNWIRGDSHEVLVATIHKVKNMKVSMKLGNFHRAVQDSYFDSDRHGLCVDLKSEMAACLVKEIQKQNCFVVNDDELEDITFAPGKDIIRSCVTVKAIDNDECGKGTKEALDKIKLENQQSCVSKVEIVLEVRIRHPRLSQIEITHGQSQNLIIDEIAAEIPGGLKKRDIILSVLVRDQDQKLTLNNIDVDENLTMASINDILCEPDLKYQGTSGNVLVVVARELTGCKYNPIPSILQLIGSIPVFLAEMIYAASEHIPEALYTKSNALQNLVEKNFLKLVGLSLCALVVTVVLILSCLDWGVNQKEDSVVYTLPSAEANVDEDGDVKIDLQAFGHTLPHFLVGCVTPWKPATITTPNNDEPIMDEKIWHFIEKIAVPGFGMVVGLTIQFSGMLGSMEKAGRSGRSQDLHFGSATFIFLGLLGKLFRANAVLAAFTSLGEALTFFIFEEIAIVGWSVLFSFLVGVIGLDFQPEYGLAAVGYVVLVMVDIYVKCVAVLLALDYYKHSWSTKDMVKDLKGRFENLSYPCLLIVFFSTHAGLDVLQQIVTAATGQICAFFAVDLGLAVLPDRCLKREMIYGWGFGAVFQVFEWMVHYGFTFPALRGQYGLGFCSKRTNVQADKAAAGHAAVEMLFDQLCGWKNEKSC